MGEASLAADLAKVRPGEGRLVGAPWLKASRLAERDQPGIATSGTVRGSQSATEEDLDREDPLRSGIEALLDGKTRRAVALLSKATQTAPQSAAAWSDLAAAYLARAAEHSGPYELPLALAAANRAVALDPRLLPARFNQALSLERLSLRSRARESWLELTRLETDSAWLAEERERLSRVSSAASRTSWEVTLRSFEEAVSRGDGATIRRLVAASPQRFREHAEGVLLPRWADLERARDHAEAERALSQLKAVSAALVGADGDRMAAATVQQIEEARRAAPRIFRELVDGFAAYGHGLAQIAAERFARAVQDFETAKRLLAAAGSPFFGWASYQVARCRFLGERQDQARRELLSLAAHPASRLSKALRARSTYLLGLVEGAEGNLTASLSAFQAAEEDFQGLRELGLTAKVRSQHGEALELLGQPTEAWRQIVSALNEPASLEQPDARQAACESASWAAQREGWTEIALLFQEELWQTLTGEDQPPVVISASRSHARLLADLGRNDEAKSVLGRAWGLLQRVPDPAARRSLEGELRLVEGRLAIGTSPAQAVAQLDRAIEIFRSISNRYRLGEALYLRALAHQGLGDSAAEERDLTAAIEESERQRGTIDAKEDRISYFDRTRALFDSMMDLLTGRPGREEEAFLFSERSKARVLWDWLSTTEGNPRVGPVQEPSSRPAEGAGPLARGLPAGTTLLEYAVLPDKTLLWVVRREGGLLCQPLKIGAKELADRIESLRRALIADRATESNRLAEDLYDQLIRPVASRIPVGDRLVVVPDGGLHTLPFGALRDRATGSYLLQRHALAVAPSARIFLETLRRDRGLGRRERPRALIAAAPDFDRDIDRTLAPLQAGEVEASIAPLFPGSKVLSAAAATRQAFLREAPSFEILYFGGHSIVNTTSPMLSQMLFAPEAGDPDRGVLYSGEILRLKLPHTRLVVLASCRTGVGRISGTEGVESLARPFLAKGVPSVIASLWSVSDASTADLFVRFYRHLRARDDVAGALQATQIELLKQRQDDPGDAPGPSVWAAFSAIGAGGWPQEP